MSGEFDPYYLWLGIPPNEQPPNHYRLLGVVMFESNRSVIEAAADRQMTFLRQYGTGPHSDASQKLLNEVSQALIELLNPEKRAAYDARLKKQIDQEVAADRSNVPVPIEPAAVPAPKAAPAKSAAATAPSAKPPAAKKAARADETYSLAGKQEAEADPFEGVNLQRKAPRRTAVKSGKPARGRRKSFDLKRWAVGGGALAVLLVAALLFWPKRTRAGSGTVELDVDAVDVTLVVDDLPIERERWGEPITLTAGRHTASLKRRGSDVLSRRFWIESGLTTEVRLEAADGKRTKSDGDLASSATERRPKGKGPKPPKRGKGKQPDDEAANPVAKGEEKANPAVAGDPKGQAAALAKLFARIPQGIKAQVRLAEVENQNRTVNAPQEVPDELFEVVMVQLLGQSGATEADVAALAEFPALRQLYLDGPTWTGDELKPLRNHAGIENVDMRLSLAPGQVPAAQKRSLAFPHLAEMPALVHVNIDSAFVSDQDLLLLKGNERLKNLMLLADDLTSEGLAAINTLPNLQMLYLSWVKSGSRGLSDDDLKILNGLSRLGVLHLSGCPELTGTGIRNAGPFPALTMARFIDCPKFGDEGMRALAEAGPKIDLISLNAKGFGGRSQAVSAVTDRSLEALRPLVRLQNLTIHGAAGITNEGLKTLVALPLLQRLDLTQSGVTSEGAADLAALRKMKFLVVAQTGIGDDACGTLAQLADLDFLSLEFTQTSDAGLAQLAPLKALRTVRAGGSRVTQKGAEDFQKEHPMCQVIGPFQ